MAMSARASAPPVPKLGGVDTLTCTASVNIAAPGVSPQTRTSFGSSPRASPRASPRRRVGSLSHREYSNTASASMGDSPQSRRAAEAHRRAAAETQRDEDARLDRLLKHIESEGTFVRQVEDYLSLNERHKQRRKQALYRDWQEKVYENIQSQIDEQLSALKTEDLSARRRQLMEDYIRVSSQKRYGLYRDIIIEAEYDPMVAHRTMLTYEMNDGKDPLKLALANQQESLEGKVVRRKVPLGRDTLDITMWDKLHATPYGRFASQPVPPPHPLAEGRGCSRVPFDHFNIPRGKEALAREFPRGKRTFGGGVSNNVFAAFVPTPVQSPRLPELASPRPVASPRMPESPRMAETPREPIGTPRFGSSFGVRACAGGGVPPAE